MRNERNTEREENGKKEERRKRLNKSMEDEKAN
jgi:hypothetical protein